MKLKLLFCLLLFVGSFGFGQIAAWDFTGESNLPTSTADVFNANLNLSPILTRGAGALISAGANSFRTQGFQNNGISTTNTDYFQFTLRADTGYLLSLTTIDARLAGTNTFANNPGVSSQFAYSLDGVNFTLIGSPQIITGTPQNLTPIDLSGVPNLQNIDETTTITLRYYASGQTTTGGWGFFSNTAGNFGLAIGGVLSPVAAGCNITNANLSTIACNDNGTTADASDDFITFDLNPSGSALGTNYNVSVSSGIITPTSGTYGANSSFNLQDGSAGSGDVTVTIIDATDNTCTLDVVIADPGSCNIGGSCGGNESFDNSNATAAFTNNSFIGDDGITWFYGGSRDEDIYPINGNGLMLRRASDSYIEATITGGVGTFSFDYRKAFTGNNARQLELIVNAVRWSRSRRRSRTAA